jgi:dihydrolipoamide dehydrogenase
MTDVRATVDVWDSDTEGVIVSWIYADGANVKEGDVLCEIMTEKVQMDLLAPTTGRLHIIAKADQVVRKDEVIARIDPA